MVLKVNVIQKKKTFKRKHLLGEFRRSVVMPNQVPRKKDD